MSEFTIDAFNPITEETVQCHFTFDEVSGMTSYVTESRIAYISLATSMMVAEMHAKGFLERIGFEL